MGWLKQISNKRLDKKRRIYSKRWGNLEKEYSAKAARNSLYLQELRKKPTNSEIIFGDWMFSNKIPFRFQKGFLKPFHRIVDFYLAGKKIIIEVDGEYHKNIVDKDIYKDLVWSNMGYKTIRLKNSEILDGTFITNPLLKLLNNKTNK